MDNRFKSSEIDRLKRRIVELEESLLAERDQSRQLQQKLAMQRVLLDDLFAKAGPLVEAEFQALIAAHREGKTFGAAELLRIATPVGTP